ncbi:PAS domain-containing protein [Dissulfurimicrobium hydrothermale]|uniref:PAS domain-containing protein n=1 Tax=Dissulfurimicrobium hydrothermale TaxID=1750598 RepID=UPI001EDC5180|nr:PAS domain-containing protein [Dissulfurimicrobium hydrothermale]UKL13345.1 PAS domain-containing protein [Dissulfurimicrobium hydrothermale]
MGPDGRFLSVNHSMARMLGYEGPRYLLQESADVGTPFWESSELERLKTELVQNGVVIDFKTVLRRCDGSVICVSLNAKAYTGSTTTIIEGFCKEEQRLGQRNVWESRMHEMEEFLHLCHSTHESYSIIAKYAEILFPDCRGGVFLFDNEWRRLKEVVSWGSPEGLKMEFDQEECWAIKRGKPYSVCNKAIKPFCGHVEIQPFEHLVYLCTPLIAQGKILGLLHIQPRLSIDNGCIGLETIMGPAAIFADYLSLSLANLKFQDWLREQSMTDPLTGLLIDAL